MASITDGEPDLSHDAMVEFNSIIMEEGDDAKHVYREAAKTAWHFVRKAIIYINGLSNKPLAWDCWLFVCEEYELLGCHEEIQLARKHHCTRANVSKLVKELERNFGMQAALRSAGGVENMRQKRKGQLQ